MTEILIDLVWLDAIIILTGITVVYVGMQKQLVPAMTPLEDRSVDGRPPEPLNQFEAELQEIGFQYCGDYVFSAGSPVKAILQGYVSGDRAHGAVVAHFETQYETMAVIEFSTDLAPFGNISTNNNRQAETFRYPLHKTIAKAPWKKSARELYDLHRSLCEVAKANGYQAERVDPARFAEEVRNDTQRDYKTQVRKGIMVESATDVYRLSLKGVILGVPKVWLRMTYGILFFWYRRSDEAFCRALQRRFDKIRSTNYAPE